MNEYPFSRVRKWCYGTDHCGEREYEGYTFGGPGEFLDAEGRIKALCSSCVTKWQKRHEANPTTVPPPPIELVPPKEIHEDE